MKTAPLIAFIILSPLVHAAPQYQAINLGLLPGTTFCQPFALNNLNQVVGTCGSGGLASLGFFWSQATGMQSLGFLPGSAAYVATAINDAGVVVGYASQSDGTSPRPFRWTAVSGMQTLPSLPDTNGSAFSINAFGYIAGIYVNSGGLRMPFLWNPNGTYQEIPLVDFTAVSALVNDSGTVVGTATINSSGAPYGFEWSPSSGVQTFRAVLLAAQTHVAGVKGQTIVGDFLGALGRDAFTMPIGGRGLRLGRNCYAASVNSLGQIVGYCDEKRGGWTATLWEPDGTQLALKGLLVNSPQEPPPYAYVINDSGAIAAYNNDPSATFLLVPVQ